MKRSKNGKLRRTYSIRRDELVEGLFNQLRHKLLDYSKTEEYKSRFVQLITKTLETENLGEALLLTI